MAWSLQHRRKLARQRALGGSQITAQQVMQRRTSAAGQAFGGVVMQQVGDREAFELAPQRHARRRFLAVDRTRDALQHRSRRGGAIVLTLRAVRVAGRFVTIAVHARGIGHGAPSAGAPPASRAELRSHVMARMVTPDSWPDTVSSIRRWRATPAGTTPSHFMERAVRIAVVGPVRDQLVSDLRALPLHPDVRRFASLYGETEELARLQPDILVVQFGAEPAEEVGALRLLRQLWPNLAVVLVTEVTAEVAQAPLAARIGALLLVHPGKPGHLAATIEQALLGSDRPHADVFLDLAHGMADEINNPLLFLSGHLQLLRAGMHPQTERDRVDQLAAALDGVQRIAGSVDRLRLLSAASNGPKHREPVDLGELLAAAARPTGTGCPLDQPTAPCVVHGDREQLTAAVTAIVRFADALVESGTPARLALESTAGAVRLRLVTGGSAFGQWRLPLTFEPYYPSRVLRGQGHGLCLFLAQTVVLGHRGQAVARRLGDGSLQVDFVLPA